MIESAYFFDGVPTFRPRAQRHMLQWVAWLEGRLSKPPRCGDAAKIAPWSLWRRVLMNEPTPPGWSQVRHVCLHKKRTAREYLTLAHQGVFAHITHLENRGVDFTLDQLQAFLAACPSLQHLKLFTAPPLHDHAQALTLHVAELELWGQASHLWPHLSEETLSQLSHLHLTLPADSTPCTLPSALQQLSSLVLVGQGTQQTCIHIPTALNNLKRLHLKSTHWESSLATQDLRVLSLTSVSLNRAQNQALCALRQLDTLELCDCTGITDDVGARMSRRVHHLRWLTHEDFSQNVRHALRSNGALKHLHLAQRMGSMSLAALLQNKPDLSTVSLRGIVDHDSHQWPSLPNLDALELSDCQLTAALYQDALAGPVSDRLQHISLTPSDRRRIDALVSLPSCRTFVARKSWRFLPGSSWGQEVAHVEAPLGAVQDCFPALRDTSPLSLTFTGEGSVNPFDLVHPDLMMLDLGAASLDDDHVMPELPAALHVLIVDWKSFFNGHHRSGQGLQWLELVGCVDVDDDLLPVRQALRAMPWGKDLRYLCWNVDYIGYDELEMLEATLHNVLDASPLTELVVVS